MRRRIRLGATAIVFIKECRYCSGRCSDRCCS